MIIEGKMFWKIDQKPLNTRHNKDVRNCFEAEDLGKITLAQLTIKDYGITDPGGLGLTYDITLTAKGVLDIELVEEP